MRLTENVIKFRKFKKIHLYNINICVSPKLLKSFSGGFYPAGNNHHNYIHEELKESSWTRVKMEEKISVETVVNLYQYTRRHVQNVLNLYLHFCEKLSSRKLIGLNSKNN
jgi:hypothetical protein